MNSKTMQKEVFDRTEKLIQKFGPRLAGSMASLDTADALYEEMSNFSDHVHKEDFFLHQGAFLGWIRLLVLCYLLGILGLWLNYPIISFLLALLSIVVLALQFFLYLPLLDRFYPRKQGRNIYGVIEPLEPAKRQIIVSGHHDSSHVFNFFIHQPKLYNLRTTGSIALVIMLTITSLVLVFLNQVPWLTLGIQIVNTLGTLLVGQMWFFSSNKVSPGAGDNLIASSIAWTLGKHFFHLKEKGEGLKSTRLILMSFDAEEEGLRGARAYAKKHEHEFKEIETYLLNIDCIYDEKELFFLTSDLNDFVPLDESLANHLKEVGASLGIPTKTQKLSFLTGGTDAAELAKKGVKATTMIGMPWTNSSRSHVYHTPFDTLEHVSPKAVEDTLNIYQEFIKQKDV